MAERQQIKPEADPIAGYAAGTTLYVPGVAWRFLEHILAGETKFLTSAVICLEDAITAAQVPEALENLRRFCAAARGKILPPIFVRPRNPDMCAEIMNIAGAERLSGLVLPKFEARNFDDWSKALAGQDCWCQPTLETAEVLDPALMRELCRKLAASSLRVALLRIGGNDLMNVLGIGRDRVHTIYDGPLGVVLANLASIFLPAGFALAAPVFEFLDEPDLLRRELALDILHGFCGKTAIHPDQLGQIRQAYMVSSSDFEKAGAILKSSQAVFRFDDAMCEPATQRHWAQNILERAKVYGIRNQAQ